MKSLNLTIHFKYLSKHKKIKKLKNVVKGVNKSFKNFMNIFNFILKCYVCEVHVRELSLVMHLVIGGTVI